MEAPVGAASLKATAQRAWAEQSQKKSGLPALSKRASELRRPDAAAIPDARKARFFEELMAPAESRSNDHFDGNCFALNDAEMKVLLANGFVVSERLGRSSCGQLLYDVYNNDFPLYLTSDSMLWAWSHTFESLFAQMEVLVMKPGLRAIFEAVQKELSDWNATADEAAQRMWGSAAKELDVLVTVFLSLLCAPHAYFDYKTRKMVNPTYVCDSVYEENKERVDKAVSAAKAQSGSGMLELFGDTRAVDWSDFMPRGHYQKRIDLHSYFHAVKWLSTTELEVASFSETANSGLMPQLKGALLLLHFMRNAKKERALKQILALQKALVGASDAMDMVDLDALLRKWNYVNLLGSLTSETKLRNVQESIVASRTGVTSINTDRSPLPQGGTSADEAQKCGVSIFGAAFTLDHFLLSKLVNERKRRTPSTLDVAYCVLDNVAAAPFLVERMQHDGQFAAPPGKEEFPGYPDGMSAEERGEEIGTLTAKTGYHNNAREVEITVHEHDTVGQLKHLLWPHCTPVLEGTTKTKLYLMASTGDSKWFKSSGPDEQTAVDLFGRDRLEQMCAGGEGAPALTFNNVFPHRTPDDAPDILDVHRYGKLRDGFDFAQELEAARQTALSIPDELLKGSVYGEWLLMLRRLSPQKGELRDQLPAAMRTKAFDSKTLNSQLASYTQLQHAFILYTKKRVLRGGCSYPEGLVELNPEFWRQFGEMVDQFMKACAPCINLVAFTDGAPALAKALRLLLRWVKALKTIEDIAQTQVQRKPLSPEQKAFLQGTMEELKWGSGPPKFSGWYPQLFVEPSECVDMDHGCVADIYEHMADPQSDDAGGILCTATREIGLIVVCVEDNEKGGRPCLYLGPVQSQYEFETPPGSRFDDVTWQRVVKSDLPSRPEWTKEFLVPKEDKK